MTETKPGQKKKIDERQMVKTISEAEHLEESYIMNILDYLLTRSRFIYGYKELFHYLTRCMCLRKPKKHMSKFDRSHLLYKKGNEKLKRELDVVNLIRSIRQLRLMASVLLGPSERMILKFQWKNVIETTSSSSDSDHYSYDTVKLLNSKRDLMRLQQIVKIKKILKN